MTTSEVAALGQITSLPPSRPVFASLTNVDIAVRWTEHADHSPMTYAVAQNR